jgi:mono/diheme cytochrome c family protein
MGSAALRRLASIVLLAAAMGAGWLYYRMGRPTAPPPESAVPAAVAAKPPYHTFERAAAGVREGPAHCASCHGPTPHTRNRTVRAFLNLHQEHLDCGVCHLTGTGLQVRRFRGDEVVTDQTLPQAPGGRLYSARRVGSAWLRALAPGEGVSFRNAGPPCSECHRRGSALLKGDGLYDPYRRRVLEDLAVLRWLPGGLP